MTTLDDYRAAIEQAEKEYKKDMKPVAERYQAALNKAHENYVKAGGK